MELTAEVKGLVGDSDVVISCVEGPRVVTYGRLGPAVAVVDKVGLVVAYTQFSSSEASLQSSLPSQRLKESMHSSEMAHCHWLIRHPITVVV